MEPIDSPDCSLSKKTPYGPRKGPANSQLAASKKPKGSSIITWLLQVLTLFHQDLLKEDQFTNQFAQERLLFSPQLGSSYPVSPNQKGHHHSFNPSLPTTVETDAYDYALGAVLSQDSDSGKHPISFHSHKLIPAELNYEIHDKELLGIIWALKHWRAFLLPLSSPFEALTNNSPLQYFRSSKVLTFRQAFWPEFLCEFHLSITCHPGHLATPLDALSHWDNIYLKRGEDFISKNPMNV
ncbi:hypothetical protein O181_056127 [Austropuccinia psidii MF-1]|uniref:Reverse transcriptase RNase H-like domain-containing protein n=1 Tax=Austropuccinia psidii MF-1 TaxID=1389203 RepID=A0A9Q3EA75_9BASI|nr:hypothetical protein [Austropuccinia psidii MF-1]